MFKKYFLCTALLLTAFSVKVFPSGIQVLNTTVTTNTDKKSAQVKFTLTWDHSWRLAATDAPANWDAAWVFIKYRTIPGDNWYHAFISTTLTNHKVPDNAELKVGTSPAVISGGNQTPGVGAFVYRKAVGNGTISFQDVELNWTFTQNGLSGGEQVEVCVLATEMVYVPQGAFYLGDLTSIYSFRDNATRSTTSAAYQITSATVPIHTNNTAASAALGSIAGTGNSDDFYTGGYGYTYAFPPGWPNGFNAFYCMKYEITQGEYLQFLNKVSVAVRNAGTYWAGATTARYGIVKKSGATPTEYELKNVGDAFLPCNFLGTKDVMAWLIWAGLRPMTEFEFEKVCRGPSTVKNPNTDAVADRPQYAWGSAATPNNAEGYSNEGMNNEGPSNADGNCAFGTSSGINSYLKGPMRAGGFAMPVSSRTKAGAAYYGVMEMSGNLRERCITFGKGGGYGTTVTGNSPTVTEGRMFRGTHGNGEIGTGTTPILPVDPSSNINTGRNPTKTDWPDVTGAGLGFRGGSYLDVPDRGKISDRNDINVSNTATMTTERKANYGGRGVRTAP